MKTWPLLFLLSLIPVATGCRSTGAPAPPIVSDLANPVADAETWRPVSFFDNPELRAETGAMDAEIAREFLETDSGLNYRVLRKSDGKKPSAASTVTVNYRGWLDSGKIFDSSYERGEAATFALQDVVAGWTEGMQLVGEGGMIELWVPSRLGYGERGSPGSIPAHANLHFVVELLSVD